MISKYDEISTAKELVKEVIANGLSTDILDRNRASDIFGHSTTEELADLANSEERSSVYCLRSLYLLVS